MNNQFKEQFKEQIKDQIEIINSISPKYKVQIAFNQKQTAELLGVSASTLENRRKECKGIEYVKLGSRILYSKSKIAEFIISSTIKTQ
jgi:hypothetical protein